MLLALLDAAHIHHQKAKGWLISQSDPSWASCPITQNGFVRIISQPSYPDHISVLQAKNMLQEATSTSYHHFWTDDLSFLDGSVFNHSLIHGPKQITDAYLLALAVRNGGQLVALDRAVTHSWVKNAPEECLVIL